MERRCGTRALKTSTARARLGAGAPMAGVRSSPVGSLFMGTIHFVQLTFQAPNGSTFAVNAGDYTRAVEYARRIVPHTSAYARLYGPNQVAVDPNLGILSAPLGGSKDAASGFYTYGDADLQGWLNQYARGNAVPSTDALAVFNPPTGVLNTDARGTLGILGYHSLASLPYLTVNAGGSGFTLDDAADVYALALSHEIAELVVDPRADSSNPEVGDPCSNFGVVYRDYFDANDAWIGGDAQFPTTVQYAYFMNGIVQPAEALAHPASAAACVYAPPA
ncbi:MAG: hypothetical protein L3K19_03170 [Thermoplasmata archaeon]|nr:hypothetical protein [Thermoplasmata archaeon]